MNCAARTMGLLMLHFQVFGFPKCAWVCLTCACRCIFRSRMRRCCGAMRSTACISLRRAQHVMDPVTPCSPVRSAAFTRSMAVSKYWRRSTTHCFPVKIGQTYHDYFVGHLLGFAVYIDTAWQHIGRGTEYESFIS